MITLPESMIEARTARRAEESGDVLIAFPCPHCGHILHEVNDELLQLRTRGHYKVKHKRVYANLVRNTDIFVV